MTISISIRLKISLTPRPSFWSHPRFYNKSSTPEALDPPSTQRFFTRLAINIPERGCAGNRPFGGGLRRTKISKILWLAPRPDKIARRFSIVSGGKQKKSWWILPPCPPLSVRSRSGVSRAPDLQTGQQN